MKEFQQFKASEGLLLFCLLGVAAYFTGQIVFKNINDPKPEIARRRAESLGLQLAMGGIYHESPAENDLTGRAPASAKVLKKSKAARRLFGQKGEIGEDPWGRPFRYKFVKQDSGPGNFIVVWSAGADRKFGADPNLIKSERQEGRGLNMTGDDVGAFYKISN